MDINFEQKVRERAYHIWMSAGMAHGSAHEHWVIAEQAVANETGMPAAVKSKAVRTINADSIAKTTPARKAATSKAAAPKTTAAKTTGTKTAKATKATTAKAGKSKH